MKPNETKDAILQSIQEMKTTLGVLDWQDPECYALWLSQTFFYVRHATRVLSKAAWRCSFEDEDLHKKMLNGINEEKNHEVMCTSDMDHIGYSLKDFTELPTTSAYYQTLYSMIDTHGPYALLGYFVSLEGLGAIGFEETFNKVLKAYGKEAVQFIEVHAHLDEGHFAEGLKHILTLPEDKRKLVVESCLVASQHYMNFLKGIQEAAVGKRSKKKTA